MSHQSRTGDYLAPPLRRVGMDVVHDRAWLDYLPPPASEVGSWEWDIETSSQTWSAETYALFGMGLAEPALDFPKFLERVHPEDRARVRAIVDTALQNHEPFTVECRVRRSDGVERLFYASGVVMVNPAGRAVRMIGTLTDITDQKPLRPARSPEVAHGAALAEITLVGVYRTDSAGRCTYLNATCCELIGLSREQAIGLGWSEVLHPGDRERVLREWEQAVQERRPFKSEYRFLRPDGSIVWVFGQAVPERQGTGAPAGYQGTVTDITERMLAEQALTVHARQQAVLAELGQQALAGPERQALLRESVTRVAGALDAHHAEILELIRADDSFVVRSMFGIPGLEPAGGRVQAGHASQAGFTLMTDAPVIVSDLRQETRFRPEPRLIERGIRGGISVPIPGRDGPFAVLAIHTLEPRAFTLDDVHFLQSVANILALAEIRENDQRIRSRLLERVLSARDEERRRLARELHDETGQSLTAMLLGLVTVEQSRTLEQARTLAARLRQITSRTIEDVGRIARGLHPTVLHDLGLAEATTRHVRDFERSCGLPVRLEIHGLQERRLPRRTEVTMYRALQEALTNCARHSRADHVHVELIGSEREAVLTIRDNGVGFDVGARLAPPSAGGLGLHGMRERVGRAGGTFSIDSAPRAGTRVTVTMPLRLARAANGGARAGLSSEEP